MTYSKILTDRKELSQKEIIPGKKMVKNLAGAFAFEANDFVALERWLLTGSTSNAFYQEKKEMTLDNIGFMISCMKHDPIKTATMIKEASFHSASNSTPLFALAILSTSEDKVAKDLFKQIFNDVVRTASQLYEYLEYNKKLRGFGKVIRTAVNGWFDKNNNLEYQFLKYQSRNGWENRDVLRKFHIFPTPEKNTIYKWAVKGWKTLSPEEKERLNIVKWFEYIKENQEEKDIIKAIREGGLSWEMVIGNVKTLTLPIWETLFEKMPMTATIRYLATLTDKGVFNSEKNLKILEDRLTNIELIKKAKIHPINLAKAMFIYSSGGEESEKSKLRYTPNETVLKILEKAINLSFDTLNSTGKKYLISVDVSGSMWARSYSGKETNFGGMAPAQIAGVLALALTKAEKDVIVCKFDTSYSIMNITKDTTYREVIDRTNKNIWPERFGGTDASLAYFWARSNKIPIDVFVSITDAESWAGRHPVVELKLYRDEVNPKAKAIYLTTACFGDRTSLVDPKDTFSYDIAGFGDNTLQIVQMIGNDAF